MIPNCLNTCTKIIEQNQAPSLSVEVIWLLSNMACYSGSSGGEGGLEISYQLSQNKDFMQMIMEQVHDGLNLKVAHDDPDQSCFSKAHC